MVNLEELRLAIRNMTRQQGIYKVLRVELTALGYWHNLPRGNPTLGYKNMLKRRLKRNA